MKLGWHRTAMPSSFVFLLLLVKVPLEPTHYPPFSRGPQYQARCIRVDRAPPENERLPRSRPICSVQKLRIFLRINNFLCRHVKWMAEVNVQGPSEDLNLLYVVVPLAASSIYH